MKSIEFNTNPNEKDDQPEAIVDALLADVPEHKRKKLLSLTIQFLLSAPIRQSTEDLMEELDTFAQKYRKRGYGAFETEQLFRAAMHQHQTNPDYAGHTSKPLLAKYQTWLSEQGYQDDLLSSENYGRLVQIAKTMIDSGETNIAPALTEKLADLSVPEDAISNQTLDQIIEDAYASLGESLADAA